MFRFFAGDSHPGFLDYLIWPWFERLEAMIWRTTTFPKDRFPELVRVKLNLFMIDAF